MNCLNKCNVNRRRSKTWRVDRSVSKLFKVYIITLTRIVCILWRQNSEENPKTENKTHQETEQKEKITTGAAADGDDDNVSDNDDDKPNISSPVAHLWTSKDGCRPLVRPKDATSTGMLHVLNINDSKPVWQLALCRFPLQHTSFIDSALQTLLN